MPKQIKTAAGKKPGHPATGRHPVTAIRLSSELRASVDTWANSQSDLPGRSEAIRRLIELGLTVEVPRQKNLSQRKRASEMAAETIDGMSDQAATADDQASRKRRLLKGPEEFRETRIDRKARK